MQSEFTEPFLDALVAGAFPTDEQLLTALRAECADYVPHADRVERCASPVDVYRRLCARAGVPIPFEAVNGRGISERFVLVPTKALHISQRAYDRRRREPDSLALMVLYRSVFAVSFERDVRMGDGGPPPNYPPSARWSAMDGCDPFFVVPGTAAVAATLGDGTVFVVGPPQVRREAAVKTTYRKGEKPAVAIYRFDDPQHPALTWTDGVVARVIDGHVVDPRVYRDGGLDCSELLRLHDGDATRICAARPRHEHPELIAAVTQGVEHDRLGPVDLYVVATGPDDKRKERGPNNLYPGLIRPALEAWIGDRYAVVVFSDVRDDGPSD